MPAKRRGHSHAHRTSGLEIDHQLELGWLLDWDVGDLGAAQELNELSSNKVSKDLIKARSIGGTRRQGDRIGRRPFDSISCSLTMLAAPGLVVGEQPMQTAAKMADFRAERSAKLLCRISNIPPALQSCERLPEGWPCLSTDSASMFGAVKLS